VSGSKQAVLVIGGGIAGIQAALDLAEAGQKVYLVEKEASIGGKMSLLDKTFPTNDCSICMESPKMLDVLANDNIELLAYAEVAEVNGTVGQFSVKIARKARYVKDDCTACNRCEEVCIVKVKNELDRGISERKAIFLPSPYAVPRVYVLDMDNCRKYGGGCRLCVVVCRDEEGKNCIDFWQRSRTLQIEVGSIIVATGFETLEPTMIGEFAYGRYPNVITSLQYERLINASGPTGGHLARPSDGQQPKSVAFIQCVGSRDLRAARYCCKVGCMYAAKQAVVTREHYPEVELYIFYMDRRAYGKGHWGLYRRAERSGIHYVRSRPARIQLLPGGALRLGYEDTERGRLQELEVDLLVLSTALLAGESNQRLAATLGVGIDDEGFFAEVDPLRRPFETAVEGIYVCGASRQPVDIAETVAQASGAAAKAMLALATC